MLNQWHYNQVHKLVLHGYQLNFSLGLCGLILFSDFYTYFSPFSEPHSLNLKLCSKQYNKNFVLHLIVAPQLSSGRQHNYSTKTRQAGQGNE